MFSAQAMAAASVSETGDHGISPDDPTSTKVLSELNLLAIHAMIIWLLLIINVL